MAIMEQECKGMFKQQYSLKMQCFEQIRSWYKKLYKKKREPTQENDQNVQSAATSRLVGG